jgi:hypothetical protein
MPNESISGRGFDQREGMAQGVRKLTTAERAYLAGLLDGEGTITLTRKYRGAHRHLLVSISNTERSVLAWVQKVVGAGRITKKRVYKPGHTLSYTYAISNIQALALLKQVVSHLRSYKRRRAELVLDRYRALTPRNGRYSAELLQRREQFINEFFAITSQGRPRQQCLGDNRAHIGEACLCAEAHDGNAEGSEGGQPQAGPVETHRPTDSTLCVEGVGTRSASHKR